MSAGARAATLLRSLLAGDSLPATPAADLGPWAEPVQALLDAHSQGGATAVRQAFAALARQTPELVGLLAAGGPEGVRTCWTVADLYAADFPPPRFVAADLLPTGMTILAGRPKLGKSWLALQLAAAVASGGALLGETALQGSVLYLALEDTPARLKDRCLKQGIPATAPVTFHTAWEPLGGQGLTDLLVAATDGHTLIVVDTLSRALGRADPMDATDMTLLLGSLQRLAGRYDLALLLVDHHRKPGAHHGDAIDAIFGSTAKAAVVDGAWGLYKQRGQQQAVLKVSGRDLSERELAVAWDANRYCWNSQGDAQSVEHTQRQQEVLDALECICQPEIGSRKLLVNLLIRTGENQNLNPRTPSGEHEIFTKSDGQPILVYQIHAA